MLVLKISPKLSIEMNLLQIQALPKTEILAIVINLDSITYSHEKLKLTYH